MPKKSAEPSEKPLSVRLGFELSGLMKTGAAKLELKDADALRLAAKIGFHFLAKINYNVALAVLDKADPPAPKKTTAPRKKKTT